MASSRSLEIFLTVLARFGGKSINLLVFLLVTRSLSLSEMGIYGFVFSTTLILSAVLDVGVRNSLAIFVGKEPEKLAAYTRAAGMLWLLAAVIAVPAMYLSFLVAGFDVGAWQQIVPAIVLLGSMVFLRMLQGTLLGSGAIAQFNRSELASRVVLLVLCVVLVLLDRLDLVAALWTLAISQFASAAYLAWCLRKTLFAPSEHWAGLARALVIRGAPFMLTVLMMQASKRMSFFAVGQLSGVEEAGLFFALQRLTEIISEVGLAVSVVVFSHSVRSASHEEAVRNAAEAARMCFAVFLIITAAFGLTAPWSVPLLIGPQFHGEVMLFEAILFGTLAGATWTILFPTLSVVARPATVMLLFLPGLVLNVVLAYGLISVLGIIGGAWALLVSNLVLTATFLVYFSRRSGIPVMDFLRPKRSDFGGVVGKLRLKRGAAK